MMAPAGAAIEQQYQQQQPPQQQQQQHQQQEEMCTPADMSLIPGAAAALGPPPGLDPRPRKGGSVSINKTSTNTTSSSSSTCRSSCTLTTPSSHSSSRLSFAPLLSDPWSAAAAERKEQVSAALLLYFACVPHKPLVPELVKQLRRAAADGKLGPAERAGGTRGGEAWDLAVRAVRGWLRGEWGVFLDCYESAPLLLRLVMEGAVARVSGGGRG